MNKSGDSTHPCLTPDVTLNQLESPFGVRTALFTVGIEGPDVVKELASDVVLF